MCAIIARMAVDKAVRLSHNICDMSTTIQTLDPAASIIERFGGIDTVRGITGASRTRVYRWTQPVERGGTGGIIPIGHIGKLLHYARDNGIEITADEFIPGPAPKEAAE